MRSFLSQRVRSLDGLRSISQGLFFGPGPTTLGSKRIGEKGVNPAEFLPKRLNGGERGENQAEFLPN